MKAYKFLLLMFEALESFVNGRRREGSELSRSALSGTRLCTLDQSLVDSGLYDLGWVRDPEFLGPGHGLTYFGFWLQA